MSSSETSTEPAPMIAVLPLWKSFWIGQLGAILVGFTIAFLLDFSRGAAALNMSDSTSELVGWAFFVPFYLMVMLSLWKCAFNTNHAILGYLARLYAIATSLLFIAILVTVILS